MSTIYHDGVVYGRLQSLGLSVRNPSPAMLTWIMVDDHWFGDQDYITMGGGDLYDATAYADSNAVHYAGLYG
jgi:hypothetical protein